MEENTCLLFRIIEHIENNSSLKINDSWYETKEKILKHNKGE